MANNSSSSSSSNSQLLRHHEIEGFFALSSSDYSSSPEDNNNDLSFWEFINPSDAESDDGDIDNLSVDSFPNGLFVSWQSSLSSPSTTPLENHPQDTHFDDRDLVLDRDLDHDHQPVLDDVKQVAYEDDGDDGNEEEDGDGDGGYDLDDELVPWSVSGKLGRQRMRKLGKRAFAKMNYSKKSPFLYMKPGCVHGKHGLGLKHSC